MHAVDGDECEDDSPEARAVVEEGEGRGVGEVEEEADEVEGGVNRESNGSHEEEEAEGADGGLHAAG